MSDLIAILVTRFLKWTQHKLYTMSQRDWSEIGWPRRLGRLMLIIGAVAAVVAPLFWLAFG